MPSPVPTPLAAAFGLVPTVLGGVRRLPGKAVQLPILALSTALTGVDAARREYDDLAQRGERLIAKLRGTSFDELEDDVEDRLQGTPFAKPYDAVEDALEDLTERVGATFARGTRSAGERLEDAADAAEDASGAVRGSAQQAASTSAKAPAKAAKAAKAVAGTAEQAAGAVEDRADEAAAGTAEQSVVTAPARTAKKVAKKAAKGATGAAAKAAGAVGTAADAVQDTAGQVDEAAAQAEVPAAERPKDHATPSATQPDSTRIDTAATPEVERTVEAVAASTGGGAVLSHDELPLADYDHMTLGSLRGRMRSLTVEQLVQIRDYEKAHADRLPIVTMLDNRIAKLASDASAPKPSGVPSDRPAAGQGDTPSGSAVSPATGGPAMNPPSAGVPTNPGQPRTTGSPGTNPDSSA